MCIRNLLYLVQVNTSIDLYCRNSKKYYDKKSGSDQPDDAKPPKTPKGKARRDDTSKKDKKEKKEKKDKHKTKH